jgi:hypothetical protein
MASNKVLKAEIAAIAEKLGAPDLTDALEGKSNAELSQILKDGKVELASYEAAQRPVVGEMTIPETTGHCIAEGKTLTSKRGILASGDKVTAEDLAGGEEAFETLVAAGYVVEA